MITTSMVMVVVLVVVVLVVAVMVHVDYNKVLACRSNGNSS